MDKWIFHNRRNRGYEYTPSGSQTDKSFVVDEKKPSPIAIIYRSELDMISRYILDYPNIETGGELFGYWTATGTPVVLFVIGPGRKAQHHTASFIQDWNYLNSIGREMHSRYRLQHIGEWHSHHQLGLAHPSSGDVNTMSYGVGKPGFPRLLLCIGNCTRTTTTVNAFNFHENKPDEYVHAAWDVVDLDSPYRHVIDAELKHILLQPITMYAANGNIYTLRNSIRENSFIKSHWLTENVENVEIMKTFVSMVHSMYPEYSVKAEILNTGEPQISIKEANVCIKLPFGFPSKSPVLLDETGALYENHYGHLWEIGEESLTTSFGRWIESVLPLIIRSKSVQTISNVHAPMQEGSFSVEKERNCREFDVRTEHIDNENELHPDTSRWQSESRNGEGNT